MKKIKPEELEEGMVLSRPLTDSFGRVLLDKGETLSALYVKKLKTWKIDEIYIEASEEEEAATGMSEAELESRKLEIDEILARKFHKVEKIKRMKTLQLSARDFLVNRLQEMV